MPSAHQSSHHCRFLISACVSLSVGCSDKTMGFGGACPSSIDGIESAMEEGLFLIDGEAIDELDEFEQTIQDYMFEYGIPNASVAMISGDDRLVLERSYTNYCGGNKEGRGYYHPSRETTTVDHRFRIASISKLVTATTLTHMTQEDPDTINLHETLMKYVALEPAADWDADGVLDTQDSRLADMILLDMATHRPGWSCQNSDDTEDELRVGDATKKDFAVQDAYSSIGVSLDLPLSSDDLIGYVSGLPLAWDPGSTWSYCNHGYMLLGTVIESVYGNSYADEAQSRVLSHIPDHVFALGSTRLEDRLENEVRYYHLTDTLTDSVMEEGARVEKPYGRFNLENREATAGWVARARDVAGLGRAFLSGSIVDHIDSLMNDQIGWNMNFRGRTDATGHTGSLEGTHSILLCHGDTDANPILQESCWSILFNKSPPDEFTDEAGEEVDPRNDMAESLANEVLPRLTSLGTEDFD